MMKAIWHDKIETFLGIVTPYLSKDEASNNLILGVGAGLRSGQYTPEVMVHVESEGQIEGVIQQTKGYGLLLSPMKPEAIEASLLVLKGKQFPFVHGESSTVQSFVSLREKEGGKYQLVMDQGIYQLTQVIKPKASPGHMRQATMEDEKLIIDWVHAFIEESMPNESEPEKNRQHALFRLQKGDFFLWTEQDQIVGMAGLSGETPNGVRINAVYTPRSHRGRGYASQLVASLSQRALDQGKKFCFLFTDLANPTSNSIYQKIGYQKTGETRQYKRDI